MVVHRYCYKRVDKGTTLQFKDVPCEASGGCLNRLFIGGLPQELPQDIAATPDRFDVVLAARGGGEFFAQLAHKHVNYFLFRSVRSAVEMAGAAAGAAAAVSSPPRDSRITAALG